MVNLNKEIIASLDSYSYSEDILDMITKLENDFNVDYLYDLSEASCQEGACKELVFWVIPFLFNLSEKASDADKIHIYIEAGMLYAYCFEIEDKISRELKDNMNMAIENFQRESIDYYLTNKFNIMEEYYLIGVILTFYQQKLGASILYGNLFAYESELELEVKCSYQHEMDVHITNNGVVCNGTSPVNAVNVDEVLLLLRAWERQGEKQDLLSLLNQVFFIYNLQKLNRFEDVGNRGAQELFVVLGTMLGYAGYVSESIKYYFMLESISCNVCHEDYILADLWDY